MSASVAWKTFDTGAPASPIVSNGRFRLASPASVLGSPSLSMQSSAQLAVVNVYSDDSGRIEAVLTVSGTTPVAIVNAVGQPFTAQQLFGLSIEVTGITNGEVLYTTDEPNGSPSSPFTSEAQRTAWATANLSTLYAGRSTVWGPGDSTEWVWNGPLATDWQEIIAVGPAVSDITGKYAVPKSLGCVALWDFDEGQGELYVSKVGYPHTLRDGSGSSVTVDDADGPVSGRSIVLDGAADFLILESGKIGSLCASAFGDNVTVLAIVKKTTNDGAGFVAGVWQEATNKPRRQYGLFVNLDTYGGKNRVCGHVSKTGTASPGIPYSRDYSNNKEWLYPGEWAPIAFTYNGVVAKSYMNGRFEAVPTYTEPGAPNGQELTYAKNPYAFALGLNKSQIGNFTVGAVTVPAGYGNWWGGKISCVAVFNKALTQAEINACTASLLAGSTTPAIWYPFRWQNVIGGESVGAASTGRSYHLSTGDDATTQTEGSDYFKITKLSGTDSFMFASVGPGPVLWLDTQNFGINLASIKKMSMLLNNGSTVNVVNFCVKIDSNWWIVGDGVSCTAAHASGADWSTAEAKERVLSSGTTMTRLNFNPGVVLSRSAEVSTVGNFIASGGKVNSLGIYSDGAIAEGAPIRIRDLKLFT